MYLKTELINVFRFIVSKHVYIHVKYGTRT